jgi:Zn-dependent peptidase ImmA (M78 family)
MAGKIKAMHYLPDMGKSVATVDLKTGVVYLNANIFPRLPEDFQQFILLHEAGHLAHNNQDDLSADKWAYQQFVKSGYQPHRAADALLSVLDVKNNPTLKLRVDILRNRALRHNQNFY